MNKLRQELHTFLESTNLSPTATDSDIVALCSDAVSFAIPVVCVNPSRVSLAVKYLKESTTRICTVIGFPSGAMTTRTKKYQTEIAVENGALEIDMVANIGYIYEHSFVLVENEISTIRKLIGKDIILKVIIEMPLLKSEMVGPAVEASIAGGADYIKSGTGTAGGVTNSHITLLRELATGRALVKAAGAVRTADQTIALIEAGADRIGTSSAVEILLEPDRFVKE